MKMMLRGLEFLFLREDGDTAFKKGNAAVALAIERRNLLRE
jgi:hypothetical protein